MASLQGWSEVALLSLLFVIVLTVIVVEMNTTYNKDYDGSFGLVTNATLQEYIDYQDTLDTGISTGEAQTNTQTGISLTSMWFIMKAGIDVTWNFVTGGWIEHIGGMARLPTVAITIFRILFVLSIGFILIKLIMKVNP